MLRTIAAAVLRDVWPCSNSHGRLDLDVSFMLPADLPVIVPVTLQP
jgi:hypothetical protein